VPRDYVEAVKWWRLAAEQGLANAQYKLGFAYSEGKGVPRDDTEAVRWWRLAAEQNVANAQSNLHCGLDGFELAPSAQAPPACVKKSARSSVPSYESSDSNTQ
jgi:TPR repeat protein